MKVAKTVSSNQFLVANLNARNFTKEFVQQKL